MRYIDLTHTLSSDIPSWNGSCGFFKEVVLDYDASVTEPPFRVQKLKMHAGIGTHMDAPSHCVPGGANIDELPLEGFFAKGCTIDVSAKRDPFYSVSKEDIVQFEKEYGLISNDFFVIIRTGWDLFWHDKEAYRNNHQFPHISKEAAELLMTRDCLGIGIDTLSPDCPSNGFFVHALFLGKGKYIIENVAHSDQLPPMGYSIIALPMKIREATESPIRLVAVLD